MKKLILCALLVSTAAMAQDQKPRPLVGVGSRTMDSCKEDTRKYCADASQTMQKACLVQNWNRISGDCQDAVAKPSAGIGGGG